MKKTTLGNIRPNIEMQEAQTCFFVASCYLALGIFGTEIIDLPSLRSAFFFMAAFFTVLALPVLKLALQHVRLEHQMLHAEMRQCTYEELEKMIMTNSLGAEYFYVGDGWRWEPQHRQMAHEILSNNTAEFFVDARKRHAFWHVLTHRFFDLISHPLQSRAWLQAERDCIATTQGYPWIHALGKETKRLIRQHDLRYHTLILGSSGAGKTTLMRLMIAQAIMKNMCVLIVDPKGDLDLEKCAQETCERTGREFFKFHASHPEQSVHINMLSTCQRASELGSRLVNVLPASDGKGEVFKDMGRRALDDLCAGMELLNQKPTIELIYKHYTNRVEFAITVLNKWLADHEKTIDTSRFTDNVDKLDYLARRCRQSVGTNTTIESIIKFAQRSEELVDKTTMSVGNLLASLSQGDLGELLSPNPDDPKPFLDTQQILRRNAVFYLATDSLTNKSLARTLGALFLSDLAAVAGSQYSFGGVNRDVMLFVDEASEVVCEPFIDLLSKARGANFSIVVATQTINDITSRTHDVAQTKRVLANCLNKCLMRCSDDDTVEFATKCLPQTSILLKARSESLTRDDANIIPQALNTGARITETEGKALVSIDLVNALPTGEYFSVLSGGFVDKIKTPYLISHNHR